MRDQVSTKVEKVVTGCLWIVLISAAECGKASVISGLNSKPVQIQTEYDGGLWESRWKRADTEQRLSAHRLVGERLNSDRMSNVHVCSY